MEWVIRQGMYLLDDGRRVRRRRGLVLFEPVLRLPTHIHTQIHACTHGQT